MNAFWPSPRLCLLAPGIPAHGAIDRAVAVVLAERVLAHPVTAGAVEGAVLGGLRAASAVAVTAGHAVLGAVSRFSPATAWQVPSPQGQSAGQLSKRSNSVWQTPSPQTMAAWAVSVRSKGPAL
jgi:hypothetical protein